jgi:hypothetical protein
MAIIISYDIPSRHLEFKEAMFEKGFTDKIVHQGKYIYLPNTTLYHETYTAKEGRDMTESILYQMNVTLERFIATRWTDWAAIWGEPFKQ